MKAEPNFRREFLGQLLGIGGAAAILSPNSSLAAATEKPGTLVNVRDLGARGDGSNLETKMLQQAIDACAQAGGGTIFFPAGEYLSGGLLLRSRVNLHLEIGATLLGSPKLEDYQVTIPKIRSYTDNYTERSLLYGENLEQVSITGQGIIDGQGAAFKGPYKVRPYLIRFVSCRDVCVQDVTLKNSPMWVQHYLACEGVSIDGIKVESRCNANNDGIDIDGCERVRISNCDIRSGDDAIVLKSTLNRRCRNVVITNCVLSSDCNAFKLGTESNGGFENIVLSNCAMYDTGLAGIALEMVDGGLLERVNVSNVTMQNVAAPIFIRLGNRARPFTAEMTKPGQGNLRGVSISQVRAVGANRIGCAIAGLPGAPVQDIALSDIQITFAGGGKAIDVSKVPENVEKYPEYSMFGALPAYGIYCRHGRGLRFENVRLEVQQADARPGFVCDDVEDLELFRCSAAAKETAMVHLNGVRNALLHACRCSPEAKTFLRVSGKSTDAIQVISNALRKDVKVLDLADDVAADVVSVR